MSVALQREEPPMRAIVLTEAASVVTPGGRRMIYIPVVRPQGYLRLGACPAAGCSNLPDGAHARICRRSDCGLSERYHERQSA